MYAVCCTILLVAVVSPHLTNVLAEQTSGTMDPIQGLVVRAPVAGVSEEDVQMNRGGCPEPMNGVLELPSYGNRLHCVWTVSVPEPDGIMQINIHYDIEESVGCGYDYLTLDDGVTPIKLCGSGVYSTYSPANTVSFIFHSDVSVSADGFNITYHAAHNGDVPPTSLMTDVDSIDLEKGETRTLLSHASGNYPEKTDLFTTIRAPTGMTVRCEVSRFSVEPSTRCQYDWVKIRDHKGRVMYTWCGTEAVGYILYMEGSLTVQLHSDYSITNTGFAFTLDAVNIDNVPFVSDPVYATHACPGPLMFDMADFPQGTVGTVVSPNWGYAPYYNDMDCAWQITASSLIKIHVVDMNIEGDALCEEDKLVIHDGADAQATTIVTLCGNNQPDDFTSSGNQLFIHFTSDDAISRRGFHLEFSAVLEEADVGRVPCIPSLAPGLVEDDGSVIGSRGHDTGADYPSLSDCKWMIAAPEDKLAYLEFDFFDVEDSRSCWFDGLRVWDGMNEDGPFLGTYCGTMFPATITASGPYLYLEFFSDSSVNKPGFQATIHFIDPPAQDIDVADASDPASIVAAATCGVPAITPTFTRIVGGQEAIPHSLPWQISLKINGRHSCGGSILSPDWIITAAHCLVISGGRTRRTRTLKVVAGEHDRRSNENTEQIRRIRRVIVHPDYVSSDDPDAALLQLSSPLSFNSEVHPICLTQTAATPGTVCVASGWGATQGTGSNIVLREVQLPIVEPDYCSNAYYGINSYHICAGYEQGGQDSCQGDSGGPLVCLENGVYTLQGLTSFGHGCAQAGYPGVYTRMVSILDWVQSNVGDDNYHMIPTLSKRQDEELDMGISELGVLERQALDANMASKQGRIQVLKQRISELLREAEDRDIPFLSTDAEQVEHEGKQLEGRSEDNKPVSPPPRR